MTTIPPPSSQIVPFNTTVPNNRCSRVQWSPADGRTAQPPLPLLVAPVSRDQGPDTKHLHLTPTSQFQRTNSSSSSGSINSRLRLRQDQVRGLYSLHLPSTPLTSANTPTILLKQRRAHTITNNPLQLQHHILRLLFHRSLVRRQYRGVTPSLPPLRSAQVRPSHSRQSSNFAQLSLRTSFVHPTIIVKTHIRWSPHPVSRIGMR